ALSWGRLWQGDSRRLSSKALSAVYDNSWTLVAGYVVLTALASAFAAKIAPETVLPHSP
ncbi:inner membrane protein, partial [Salmonella enterica subsp. enterica serovar Enteritidis str. 22558]